MLRRDSNAKFVSAGIFGTKMQFQTGKLASYVMLKSKDYRILLEQQESNPIAVMQHSQNPRKWWMFLSQFYWEDEGLSQREVKALLLERLRKKNRQLERAISAMDGASQSSSRRERIPESVQSTVWNRDGGRCILCGNRERLEFDHIIPVSKGGANTARNLQLLCERCNRSKGAQVG